MSEKHIPIHKHPYQAHQDEKLAQSAQGVIKPLLSRYGNLLAHAKKDSKWLYDPLTHEWYSPEDFEKEFADKTGLDILMSRIVIKDPKEGIDAGYKTVIKVQEKWNNLIRRVIDWEKRQRK